MLSILPGSWAAGVKAASCFLSFMHYLYPVLPALQTEEEQRRNPKPNPLKLLLSAKTLSKELEWNSNIFWYLTHTLIGWYLTQLNLRRVLNGCCKPILLSSYKNLHKELLAHELAIRQLMCLRSDFPGVHMDKPLTSTGKQVSGFKKKKKKAT